MAELKTTEHQLQIKRTFEAPRDKVFDAFTQPDHLLKWWRANPKMTTSRAEVDLRVGGKYRFGMKNPDNNQEYVSYGEYREIDRPHKLVFTWAFDEEGEFGEETLVTLELIEQDGGTELTLTHTRFPSETSRNEHRKGWEGCLDMLKSHVE